MEDFVPQMARSCISETPQCHYTEASEFNTQISQYSFYFGLYSPEPSVYAVSHLPCDSTPLLQLYISNHLFDFQCLLQPNRSGCLNKPQRTEDAVSYGSRLLIIEMPWCNATYE